MDANENSIEPNGSPSKRPRRASTLTEEALETMVEQTEGVALPECEKLASLRVGDLKKRSSSHHEVAEILDTLESGLRSADPDVLRDAIDKVRNAPSEMDYIRRERWLVRRAVEKRDVPPSRACWKELEPQDRRRVKAHLLCIDLGCCDPRYLDLDVDFVVELLEKCSLKKYPGAGCKNVAGTLAEMMDKVGAHNVSSYEQARSEIDRARSKTKTKAPLNPLRLLSEK